MVIKWLDEIINNIYILIKNYNIISDIGKFYSLQLNYFF